MIISRKWEAVLPQIIFENTNVYKFLDFDIRKTYVDPSDQHFLFFWFMRSADPNFSKTGIKIKLLLLIHIYAPNFEEVDGAYWFRVVCVCMCPFVTLFDASHILWTVHARVLKFHIWIPHGKIADLYFFFSCPSYPPFWSYAPLKKSEWNLVSKISWKVFELGAWNMVIW